MPASSRTGSRLPVSQTNPLKSTNSVTSLTIEPSKATGEKSSRFNHISLVSPIGDNFTYDSSLSRGDNAKRLSDLSSKDELNNNINYKCNDAGESRTKVPASIYLPLPFGIAFLRP